MLYGAFLLKAKCKIIPMQVNVSPDYSSKHRRLKCYSANNSVKERISMCNWHRRKQGQHHRSDNSACMCINR